jgi:ribonuclease HI
MTMCKNELQNKALELKNELQRQNLNVLFNDSSFRDYLVKLTVSVDGKLKGYLLLYYKPTKNTFSLRRQIEDLAVDCLIDFLWNKLNNSDIYSLESGIYEAFVDGSYILGTTGYGAVIYLGNEIKTEISGTISDVQFRQFGGELKSVIETLKWCGENSVKKIRINYDYEGIEKFALGKWKAKNTLAMEYTHFIHRTQTKIEWRHIKSHTSNIKNDRADFLAKKAATTNKIPNKTLFYRIKKA